MNHAPELFRALAALEAGHVSRSDTAPMVHHPRSQAQGGRLAASDGDSMPASFLALIRSSLNSVVATRTIVP